MPPFPPVNFDAGQKINYTVKTPGNGVYIFVLEGDVNIEDVQLNKRDAIGVYDTGSLIIDTNTEAQLLIIEVPMT